MGICDYLFERIKRETRSKAIQQSAYLLVKGLVKAKVGDKLFEHLDTLFDIPKREAKEQKSEEELINEFEDYVKGA